MKKWVTFLVSVELDVSDAVLDETQGPNGRVRCTAEWIETVLCECSPTTSRATA